MEPWSSLTQDEGRLSVSTTYQNWPVSQQYVRSWALPPQYQAESQSQRLAPTYQWLPASRGFPPPQDRSGFQYRLPFHDTFVLPTQLTPGYHLASHDFSPIRAPSESSTQSPTWNGVLLSNSSSTHSRTAGRDRYSANSGKDTTKLNAIRASLQHTLQSQIDSCEECAMCLDTLTNPVITPCAHVYCRKCIERACNTSLLILCAAHISWIPICFSPSCTHHKYNLHLKGTADTARCTTTGVRFLDPS